MAQTFLINLNCSKILNDGEETQYAMLIDSKKMSIVYELVEWIRWMFSLETCIYITHNGSVIHELEDINLLSQLKNFEVKPCGRSQCVHKKTYRTLLKNLDLFTYWNGILVHKYFLHKLNQVDQKLSEENYKSSPAKFTLNNKDVESIIDNFDKTTDSTKKSDFYFSENKLPEVFSKKISPQKKSYSCTMEPKPRHYGSPAQMTSYSDNFPISSSNYSNDSSYSNKNLIKHSTKSNNFATNNDNEKNFEIYQEPSKNNFKAKKSYVKPFSLGALLSNLREDVEKCGNISKQSDVENLGKLVPFEDENFDDKLSPLKNLFTAEDELSGGKKRKRVRKRKRAKKQNSESEEYVPPFVDRSNNNTDLNFSGCNGKAKPNHIRFDEENEDNIMETDFYENEQRTQLESESGSSGKEIKENNFQEYLNISPKKIKLFDGQVLEQPQITSASKNAECKTQSSGVENPLTTPEEKLIDLDDQIGSNTCQLKSLPENVQENTVSQDLNMLLSLKEKCKNGIVIERFY